MTRSPIARLLVIAVAFALLGAAGVAQEAPKPAKELAKYDRLLGSWEGSGTALTAPGAPMAPWTATVIYKKILGGHFIQEDVLFKAAAPGVPLMRFRSIYGWDGEHKRHVVYSFGNLGGFDHAEPHWDGDTLIITNSSFSEGKPTITREIINLTKDGWKFDISGCTGSSPFSTWVEGSFKRKTGNVSDIASAAEKSGERVAAAGEKAAPVMKAPAVEMKKLGIFVGNWKLKGKVVMALGTPPMDIGGTGNYFFSHDGHILMFKVVGDPKPDGSRYLAHGYMAWNKRLNLFESFHMNSMGMSGVSLCRFNDEGCLVACSAAMMMGQPAATRMMFRCNKDGTMSGYADGFSGTANAVRTFEGTYTPIK